MIKPWKIYNNHFGIGSQDMRPCEITGHRGHDIHHIFGREMNEHMLRHKINDTDNILNLMSLRREAHEFFGQREKFNEWLFEIHLRFLEDQIPYYFVNPRDCKLMEFLVYLHNNQNFKEKPTRNFYFK